MFPNRYGESPVLFSKRRMGRTQTAVPTKPFREAWMSRYRALKIGGAFFYALVLADRGSDLLVRHIDRLRHTFPASHHSPTHLLPPCSA